MPVNKEDYVSEGGKVAFDPYFKPEKVEGLSFSYGEVGQPNNQGQDVPTSQLASDQSEFTGPDMSTFTKNEGKHSEDSGLPYNKGDEVGV